MLPLNVQLARPALVSRLLFLCLFYFIVSFDMVYSFQLLSRNV